MEDSGYSGPLIPVIYTKPVFFSGTCKRRRKIEGIRIKLGECRILTITIYKKDKCQYYYIFNPL